MERKKPVYPIRLTSEEYFNVLPGFTISESYVPAPYPIHWHEFFEIELVVSGRGLHIMNGDSCIIEKGSLFLVTPVDVHEMVPGGGSALEMLNIKFHDEMVDKELCNLLFEKKIKTSKFQGEEFSDLLAVFKRLTAEYRTLNTGRNLIIKGGLERILVDLLRKGTNTSNITAVKHNPIQMSLAFIHYHFRDKITLGEVAKKSLMSANYFSECFHKIMGVSYQDYLNKIRFDYARKLLSVSDFSVTEICYASGFNSLPYFTRFFKKTFGVSPLGYRKNLYVCAE